MHWGFFKPLFSNSDWIRTRIRTLFTQCTSIELWFFRSGGSLETMGKLCICVWLNQKRVWWNFAKNASFWQMFHQWNQWKKKLFFCYFAIHVKFQYTYICLWSNEISDVKYNKFMKNKISTNRDNMACYRHHFAGHVKH